MAHAMLHKNGSVSRGVENARKILTGTLHSAMDTHTHTHTVLPLLLPHSKMRPTTASKSRRQPAGTVIHIVSALQQHAPRVYPARFARAALRGTVVLSLPSNLSKCGRIIPQLDWKLADSS